MEHSTTRSTSKEVWNMLLARYPLPIDYEELHVSSNDILWGEKFSS